MVSIGAIHHENPANQFYAELRPLNDNYQDRAYEVNGFTHEQVQSFADPEMIVSAFYGWVKEIQGVQDRIYFVSDTTSFDFSFVNYYLWLFVGENPFGHAPMSLTNLRKGLTGNYGANIYDLRDTAHTHNALDDAIGNHEAFTKIERMMEQQRRRLKNQPLLGGLTSRQNVVY